MDSVENIFMLSANIAKLKNVVKHCESHFRKIESILEDRAIKAIDELKSFPSTDRITVDKINKVIKEAKKISIKVTKLERLRKKYERRCYVRKRELLVKQSRNKEHLKESLAELEQKFHIYSQVPVLNVESDLLTGYNVQITKPKILEAIICDYLSRSGKIPAAEEISKNQNLKAIFDIEIYKRLVEILSGFENGDFEEAYRWCRHNKTKKTEKLLLKLKLYELLCLTEKGGGDIVRNEGRYECEALDFIRSNFNSDFIQKNLSYFISSMLVFGNENSLEKIAENKKELKIEESFKRVYVEYYQISQTSPLEILICYGVAMTMTKSCYESREHQDGANLSRKDCPMCVWIERFPRIALMEKFKPTESLIFCRKGGNVIDQNNPALMTLYGSVYGQKALLTEREKNTFFCYCKIYNKYFKYEDCKKVYVV